MAAEELPSKHIHVNQTMTDLIRKANCLLLWKKWKSFFFFLAVKVKGAYSVNTKWHWFEFEVCLSTSQICHACWLSSVTISQFNQCDAGSVWSGNSPCVAGCTADTILQLSRTGTKNIRVINWNKDSKIVPQCLLFVWADKPDCLQTCFKPLKRCYTQTQLWVICCLTSILHEKWRKKI